MNRYCVMLILLVCIQPAMAEGPGRFGFGRIPSDPEIRAWDIDIMPDGRQLPPGRGSVAMGKQVYTQKCLACHGPEGKGGANVALVEQFDPAVNFSMDQSLTRAIGNFWPYATTLYDYIKRAMPYETPGTLQPDEIYSLVAYLLYLNRIIDAELVMDADSLPAVVMPARKLFYFSDEVEVE